MTALAPDPLPASLVARLTEEQLQAVREAARGQRLAALAGALALPEPEALTALAAAAGLDIASNLETDPDARGLLPARLVHDYQIPRARPPPSPTPNSPPSVRSPSPLSTSPPPGCPMP